MMIKNNGFKIKLIKPFYGHDGWRTKPLATGRVLNYTANPQRGLDLIEKGVAVEYE